MTNAAAKLSLSGTACFAVRVRSVPPARMVPVLPTSVFNDPRAVDSAPGAG